MFWIFFIKIPKMRISKYSQSWYQSKNNRVSRFCVVLCTLNTPSHPPGTWKNVENCNLIEKTDFSYLIYVTYHSQFNVPTLLYWYMYITLNYKTSPADRERCYNAKKINHQKFTCVCPEKIVQMWSNTVHECVRYPYTLSVFFRSLLIC